MIWGGSFHFPMMALVVLCAGRKMSSRLALFLSFCVAFLLSPPICLGFGVFILCEQGWFGRGWFSWCCRQLAPAPIQAPQPSFVSSFLDNCSGLLPKLPTSFSGWRQRASSESAVDSDDPALPSSLPSGDGDGDESPPSVGGGILPFSLSEPRASTSSSILRPSFLNPLFSSAVTRKGGEVETV